jgi:2-polyprenyl-3-methyl-5-hydroxy-6-metoxy-1,4-benzoquinol methylase
MSLRSYLRGFTRNSALNTALIDFNQLIRFNYIASNLKVITKQKNNKLKLNILDVGSGLGNLSEHISERQHCSIINVEITAKRKLPNMVVADGSSLPFVSQAFDFVVSCDVFEHVNEKSRSAFIKETLRCCKQGLVLTYSKIHQENLAPSGIKIFEKLAGFCPDWYTEHNENKIVNDTLLIKNVKENGAVIKNTKPLIGIIGLFFTGFIIFVPSRLKILPVKFFLQVTSLLLTRAIDIPPFYGFGLTAVKTST